MKGEHMDTSLEAIRANKEAFADALANAPQISQRNADIAMQFLKGFNVWAIAKTHGISKSRASQIIKITYMKAFPDQARRFKFQGPERYRITTRTENCLANLGLYNADDVRKFRDEHGLMAFIRFEGLGRKSFNEIIAVFELDKESVKPLATEYAFDVKLFATIRVKADSEEQARAMLREHLDTADANFGAWPDGTPILAEASMEGTADLIEVDGEAVC